MDNLAKKNTVFMLSAQIIKMGFQGLAFLLVARTLGPENFGIIIALMSVNLVLSPFVDMGSYFLMVKNISHGSSEITEYGNSVLILLLSLPLVLLLIFLIQYYFYAQISLSIFIFLLFSQLLFDKMTAFFAAINVAYETIWRISIMELLSGVLRLMAAILFFLYGDNSAQTWSFALMLQSLILALIAIIWIRNLWGFPKLMLSGTVSRLQEGWHYAINQLSQYSLTETDKIMMSNLATLTATGIYAASMRVLNLAFMPMNAFLMVIFSRYFKTSEQQFNTPYLVALNVLPITFTLSLFTFSVLFFLAPYFYLLVGDGYKETAQAIKIAAFIPLLQSISTPFADSLSGLNKQNIRARISVFALMINITLNLLLIPEWGWKGAVWATIFSQIIYTSIIFMMSKRYSLSVHQAHE